MSDFVEGSAPEDIRRVPCMCWLIRHEASGKIILLDLGLRKDIENYTPAIYQRLQTKIKAEVPEDVYQSLDKLNVDPKTDVDQVIFTHVHYDHTGDPSRLGSRTTFLLGPGAGALIKGPKSYPTNATSSFDSDLLPPHRRKELPPAEDSSWIPFGPFPQTLDYFGDGSLRIVNAPGHLDGHINILLRTGSNNWVFLGGDSCHDLRLLQGTAKIAVIRDEISGNTKCAHVDKKVAEQHLQRIRDLGKHANVEIILAHDREWLIANEHRF